jgi:predicted RNase H-like HicB family nuclease
VEATMNTPRKGAVRCIVFKDEDTWYGVALELNIVEEGDDFDVVMFNLQEAIRGYVASMKKAGIETKFDALNQEPDAEYAQMWNNLHADKPIPSPYQVKYYGVAAI